MKFIELQVQNFLAFGPRQTISLQHRGLTAVLGQNREAMAADSNGAGKSSILEALVWVLYGKTMRDYKGDQVINRTVGSDCQVTLVLEDERGVRWDVTRFRAVNARRPNELQLLCDGNDPKQQGITADTQELVETIVGMDIDTFVMSVLMSYGGKPFAELTDAPRKAAFDSIMQTGRFARARDAASARVRARQEVLAGVNTELQQLEERRADTQKRSDRLVEQRDAFESDQRSQRLDLQRRKVGIEAEMEGQLKIDGLDRMLDIQNQLERELQHHRQEVEQNRRKLDYIKKDVAIKREALAKNRGIAEGARQQLSQLVDTVNELVGKPCPTCGRAVPFDEADGMMASSDQQIRQFEEQLAAIDHDRQQLDELSRRETQQLEANNQLLANTIQRLEAQQQIMRSRLAQRSAALQLICQLEQQAFNVAAEIDRLDAAVNPYGPLYDEAYRQLRELTERMRRLRFRQQSLDLEIHHLLFWEHGFGNQGLRSFVIEGALPFLNERVQQYADIVSGGDLQVSFSMQRQLQSGKQKEEFDVRVVNRQGADVYQGNSDGEKRRINTAIGWAFGDLAAMRANKPVGFKGLDEPFTNLDETGEDGVMRLLHTVAQHYDTVLCITHSDHLKNQFPTAMTVVKEGGFARVEDA